MTSEREWHPTPGRCSGSLGMYVECNGQLGYAKFDSRCWWKAKLASELAHVVCAPVPRVEFGTVAREGKSIRASISHMHTRQSSALGPDEGPEREYSSAEIAALKTASGLIPFLVWIGATDHAKQSNFVVDDLGEGRSRVVAIDFEHAFHWLVAPQYEKYENFLRGLRDNFDCRIVGKTLEKIEQLSADAITACCRAAGLESDEAERISSVLQYRQGLIRDLLDQHGWLC
jgi:hypothetical protein